MIRHRSTLTALPAAFLILSAAFLVAPIGARGQSKTNVRTPETTPAAPAPQRRDDKKPPDPTKYSYEFTQPNFVIRHIQIDHDAQGRGKIKFERKNEETSIEEPLELSMAALGRVLGAWTDLRFLDSTENYQSNKQFPHLGTMRFRMENDKRNRTAEFNWTDNKNAALLANEYRKLSTQAVLVFDISVARESQPLN